MKKQRNNLAWPFIQASLPKLPLSLIDPTRSSLSPAGQREALLLRLTDEQWKQYTKPIDGDGTTGDSVVDRWEKDIASGVSVDDLFRVGGDNE